MLLSPYVNELLIFRAFGSPPPAPRPPPLVHLPRPTRFIISSPPAVLLAPETRSQRATLAVTKTGN